MSDDQATAPRYAAAGSGVVHPAKLSVIPNPENARALAIYYFRRLADQLESGELDGARISWREGWSRPPRVELDRNNGEVRAFDLRDEGK